MYRLQTKEEERQVDGFLEGDIMLTIDQAEGILDDSAVKRRRKRKMAEPASKRWTLPIPYMFDGSHSTSPVIIICCIDNRATSCELEISANNLSISSHNPPTAVGSVRKC